MTNIHPTAIVAQTAQLGENVKIGPFAIIEEGVCIGDRSEIMAQAQIRSQSIVGADCAIGSGALVGADPHYVGFNSETPSWARLGDRNIIREYVTLHRSIEEGGETVLGDDNYLMNGAHLGHDCQVGNHNILANNVLLGGHVKMGNHCFLGGGSVYHQFIRIGDYVMAQGLAGTSHDIPPYTMLAGTDNEIAGLNVVGIKRGGFESEDRKEIKEIFRIVYRSQLNLKQAIEKIDERSWGDPAVVLINFLKSETKKGFCLKLYK
ncbi:MAG: acyl-ACP--UDP-N-acetylglucosamine O-acyltransferase [Verrucomicrobiales bacterium]|nr:acyl-ACP--UDP-N-acetylglucosamine O-acyltransferase [Verrucomicrobiales bacterium]